MTILAANMTQDNNRSDNRQSDNQALRSRTFALSSAQRVLVLNRYRAGKDVATTYKLLWPAQAPITLGQFIGVYHAAIVEFLGPVSAQRFASRSVNDDKALSQILRMQELTVKAFEQIVENPIVEEDSSSSDEDVPRRPRVKDRLCLLGGLMSGWSALEKARYHIEVKAPIERAAALHSLLASNADRDGDVIDIDAEARESEDEQD